MAVYATADADLKQRFAPQIEEIAALALAQEQERELPHRQVRALADAGFGALRLPLEEGGSGATLSELFALLIELGAADSNQPQIWRNHIAFVEDRLVPDAELELQNRRWREVVASGAVIGGAWSERTGAFAEMATRVNDGDEGPVVTGEKYYSTGSIFADWISVYARRANASDPASDNDLIVMVRADSPGVETVEDWAGFGQRTTGSGTTRLRNASIGSGGIFLFGQRAPYQEAVYQLVHVATLAGIARAAHRDLIDAVLNRKRSYKHAAHEVPSRDPQVQAVVGRVSALAASAEASVLRASGYLDRAADAVRRDEDDAEVMETVYAATVAVYESQVGVCDAVLAATTLLFDALSSSAVDVSRTLDRHWRNARTVSSHNPRIYKDRIVGDWYLNGTAPQVYDRDETDTAKATDEGHE
jgi:alkylation response protein AidB-like acyl-CoA dehydrogenase